MVCKNARALGAGLLALALSGAGWAQDAAAEQVAAASVNSAALDRRIAVDLSEQTLSAAIIELTKLAGVQLVMPGGPLHEETTPGLHGEMTLREALTRLLKGSGATFRETSPGTIAIDVPGRRSSSGEDAGADLASLGGSIVPTDTPSIAVPELASTGAQTGEPQEEADGVQRLEEIVVTSTKRAQSVRDIPQSIVGLSGEDMERANIKGIEDIARIVPGVNVTEPGDSAPRVTIRGIAGQSSTNATTGILYGDIAFTDTYLPRVVPDPLPFDLQSVEVLKGPQGTLFGASALNGAIRYVPEPAKLGLWETKYMLEYTSISQGDSAPVLGAVVNMPVERLNSALRLTAYSRESPGYIDNTQVGADVNSVKQTGARGSLVMQPSERLNGTLTYAWQDTQRRDVPIADNRDGDLITDNRPRNSPADFEYHFAEFKLSWDFDWAQLVSDSGFVRKSAESFFDATSRLSGSAHTVLRGSQEDHASSDSWSQELRLVSPDDGGDWRWVAGVAGFRQDIDYYLRQPIGLNSPATAGQLLGLLGSLVGNVPGLDDFVDEKGEALLVVLGTQAQIQEMSLFGEVTRRFAEDWELTLGGRLYKTTSQGTVHQASVLFLVQDLDPVHDFGGTLHEQGFNPKASLMWHASRDLIAYASASKGFRVGGVQPGFSLSGPAAPEFFKSDSLWSYELGLRTQWLDRQLRADVTGFHTVWKNPQTFQNASLTAAYIDNAGGVENYGVETTLQAALPWGLQFNTSAAWTDTYTTMPFQSQGGEVPSGSQWPFAPHWQTASSLTWALPLGTWLVAPGVSYSTISDAPNNLDPSTANKVFGYQQLDFALAVRDTSVEWMPEFSLALNNALDERGVSNYYIGALVPTVKAVDTTYIRPRTLTLRIAGRF